MSSRRPSAAVYRRRRIVVLGLAIVLIAAAFWGVGAMLGDEPTPKKATPTTPTATTPTPTVEGQVPVTTLSGTATCASESIRMSPYVPAKQTAGGPVTIDLTLTTSSAEPCTYKPKAADILVVISQNDTAIYDSTVCKESLLPGPVTLSPMWSTVVHTTWTGRGSGRDCSKKVGFATPGAFRLQIGALGGEPGETRFTLAQKPKPKPTPTPEANAD